MSSTSRESAELAKSLKDMDQYVTKEQLMMVVTKATDINAKMVENTMNMVQKILISNVIPELDRHDRRIKKLEEASPSSENKGLELRHGGRRRSTRRNRSRKH
jgi:hypothetical protein